MNDSHKLWISSLGPANRASPCLDGIVGRSVMEVSRDAYAFGRPRWADGDSCGARIDRRDFMWIIGIEHGLPGADRAVTLPRANE